MDLRRYRGDTYPDEFVITDNSGSVLDITGYTFLLTLNTEQNPTNTTNQVYQIVGVIVDAAAGVVSFAPSVAQADNVGTFYYDIQITDDTAAIKTLQKGKYVYLQDVTK